MGTSVEKRDGLAFAIKNLFFKEEKMSNPKTCGWCQHYQSEVAERDNCGYEESIDTCALGLPCDFAAECPHYEE